MRLQALILLLTLSHLFGLEAQFQGDSLKGSLGDIITFGWDIYHSEDAKLTITELDLEGSGIEILNSELTSMDGGSRLRYNTAIYDSVGVYTFPSSIAYVQDGKGLDSLYLRGPDLEITSVLSPSDTTFRDIKGIHNIRTPINLLYILIFVVALILAYVIYYIIKRMNRSVSNVTPQKIIVPPEEAHVIALRAFESLRRSKYVRFEQFKDFYSELTHILKQYYENRYLIDALEQTTSEFLVTMKSIDAFDAELISETHDLLEKADFIKFAKARSDELESGKALNLAVDIVNRTKIEINQGEDT